MLKRHRLVDLVGVMVFVLVLVTAVFFFLRRATYVTIVMMVSQSDALDQSVLPMWYLNNLKAGMVQKDILGKPVISVLKSYSYDSSNISSKVTFLTMKLLTAYDARNKMYLYEGVPLLIGSYQNFKIDGVFLRGVVYRILDKDYVADKKTILIEGYLNPTRIDNQDAYGANTISNGVLNYLADKFKVGGKIMDSDGSVLAEIKDVKKMSATRKFIFGSQLIEEIDRERQQVWLKVAVDVEKVNGIYLFQGVVPVRINSTFWLGFHDFDGALTVRDYKEI